MTRAAAADCRIRAVALVATPSDAEAQTRAEYRGAGPAAILGALAVYRFRGIDLEMERPLTFIASIAPRPVAIFAGTEDRTVPFEEGRELFAAARQPKEFHRIEHGDHGQYARSDSTYAPALRRFFASALAGPAATTECSR